MAKIGEERFLWKLTLGLEIFTYLCCVPIGMLFILTASGFFGEKFLPALITMSSASLISMGWSVIRFLYLRNYLRDLFVGELSEGDALELKRRIMKAPLINVLICLLQWSGGIIIGYVSLYLWIPLTVYESLPYAVLPLLVYPILIVTHFLYTESSFAPVLEHETLAFAELKEGYTSTTFFQRILFSIIALLCLPVNALFYLVLGLAYDFISLPAPALILCANAFLIVIALVRVTFLLAASLRRNVGKITDAVKDLTAGRIRRVIPMTSSDELALTCVEMNLFIEKFGSIIRAMREQGQLLDESSGKLARTTEELSGNMREQASMTEEIGAAVEQFSASISMSDDQATSQMERALAGASSLSYLEQSILRVHESTRSTMARAKVMEQSAREGVEISSEALRMMKNIENSSDQISQFVNVINEIADQVSLLSLNASIEAARAGEAGRGFAVVAQEISRLGEKTIENARLIHGTIEEALRGIQEGMGVIQKSNHSFQSIQEAVTGNIGRIEKIAGHSEEQLAGRKKVQNDFESISGLSTEIRNTTREQSGPWTKFRNRFWASATRPSYS